MVAPRDVGDRFGLPRRLSEAAAREAIASMDRLNLRLVAAVEAAARHDAQLDKQIEELLVKREQAWVLLAQAKAAAEARKAEAAMGQK
uniref:Uncharacterized protein n=1 Tax=Tetradesmus obliquus TaxID=3088 RepID=A0A383WN76_TETOB